ncbi:hypothetical protein AMTR_s00006p00250810 [Amborella trichopoda]|uniref:Uncharacterized protein n=1 Tax=Amborella trichopoda TaxID=13333 RepID=W1PCT3_AMBTC|nr:hypothetical protein AMTR_s00006p00250810 [Amborella trichopoda]
MYGLDREEPEILTLDREEVPKYEESEEDEDSNHDFQATSISDDHMKSCRDKFHIAFRQLGELNARSHGELLQERRPSFNEPKDSYV